MPSAIDVTGQRFGRFLVTGPASPSAKGRRRVMCQCDCGTVKAVEPRWLRSGDSASCGCLQQDRAAEGSVKHHTTHGMTRTREYNAWCRMKSRCERKEDARYPEYGGRGIKICDEWRHDFQAFFASMGVHPGPGWSIDRIDVDGDYAPENCRWATAKEQARNKRRHRLVEHDGRTMPLSEACELTGINYRGALYRLHAGLPWRPLPHGLAGEAK